MAAVSVMLKEKFSRVTYKDIIHIFKFLFALPLSAVYRIRRGKMWLISEYAGEARDNAYRLFQYLRQEHPEIDAVYAISINSSDFKKVENLGEIVSYSSLRHWVYYLAAEVNVSSQKGGKPNAAVCYLFEVSGLLKNKRVLLQHGIILNDVKYLYYKETKISLFICGAKPEFEFVKKRYGYPEGSVVCAGMCRYDALINEKSGSDGTILVVPTWRKWIAHGEGAGHFTDTLYFKRWQEFLNSPKLEKILAENGVRLIFCPHRNMEKFLKYFSYGSQLITLLQWSSADIQKRISASPMLVTDYSSISTDFAYMHKPLIYYQFDAEEFRQRHLEPSYFDYMEDGFGPLCSTLDELLSKISAYAGSNFAPEEKYTKRAADFFAHIDNGNCARNYNAIMKLLGRGR
ncbi:CDP-glycerol glycerophosphotransferase family protein [Synergistes jonesii]|nr:CDP-glycerol glycerophosphotransferase family protein [Synergistes jonesii]